MSSRRSIFREQRNSNTIVCQLSPGPLEPPVAHEGERPVIRFIVYPTFWGVLKSDRGGLPRGIIGHDRKVRPGNACINAYRIGTPSYKLFARNPPRREVGVLRLPMCRAVFRRRGGNKDGKGHRKDRPLHCNREALLKSQQEVVVWGSMVLWLELCCRTPSKI